MDASNGAVSSVAVGVAVDFPVVLGLNDLQVLLHGFPQKQQPRLT